MIRGLNQLPRLFNVILEQVGQKSVENVIEGILL